MKILGISCFYHDSAAALIEDGHIVAAAQEERFTRKKQDASFPLHAIQFCLHQGRMSIDDLDAIVFYDKPLLKFERLLDTYYGFAPQGWFSFINSMQVWVKEKLFLKKLIRDNLKKISRKKTKSPFLLFPEHHLSHAASAFYPSGLEESAILTIDGVGEWATASICHGKKNEIQILKELHFPHSLGLLYSAFTYYLGFKVNSGEYKLMGLAPYGNPGSEETDRFISIIKKHLIEIKDDGSIWLNQQYFNYATGLRMARDSKWAKWFGFKRRQEEDELEQHHCNLALAIQTITEEVVLKLAEEAKRLTQSENVCLAGGVALNAVANGKLHESGIFKNIFIQPAAGDAGGALGAALAAYYIHFEKERVASVGDQMQGSFLGNEISNDEIKEMISTFKAFGHEYQSFDDLCMVVSTKLAEGNVIGWVEGRMEFGPRALGARSILADPRNIEMQKKLNLKIKFRESFRPFAPSVLAEDVSEYFDFKGQSPYMLLVKPVTQSLRKPLPANFSQMNWKEKLYYQRSEIPAITHVDFSARLQTVHRETNPKYYRLLETFKQQTGCSVLVNTSFNVRGEPIVCTAADAYRCFMNTEMDFLVVGNFLFDKGNQPKWNSSLSTKTTFGSD